jgi:hypothetical protein
LFLLLLPQFALVRICKICKYFHCGLCIRTFSV